MWKLSQYAGVIVAISLVALAGFFKHSSAQQTNSVDLNIVLAIDCSYSVDEQEYVLQMAGMAAAFIDPTIIEAIRGGVNGAIAVSVVQWANPKNQIIVVPWTRVASTLDGQLLAAKIARTPRRTSEGSTSISGVLKFGQQLLRSSPYKSRRNIIDVVADGENNNGERVERVRDRLVSEGITINALAIQNEVGYLRYYMRNRVIGGGNSFVEPADDYLDFGRAIYRKLLREIQGVPIG